MIEESIKRFLPKYLSPEDQSELIKCIDDFPDNLDNRFYTSVLRGERTLFQGDGIKDLLISNLPNKLFKQVNCLIISNTCDISTENKRTFFDPRIAYSAIIDLGNYKSLLERKGVDASKIESHIMAVKKQMVTQIFYLPRSTHLNESIVFLDRVNNCSVNMISSDEIEDRRLFTLSNYGFYIFLLKLSMSFTRIGEKVNRKIQTATNV